MVFAEVCWDCSNFGKSSIDRGEAVVPAHPQRGGRPESPYLRDNYLPRPISLLIHILFPSEKKNSLFHLHSSEGKKEKIFALHWKEKWVNSDWKREPTLQKSN